MEPHSSVETPQVVIGSPRFFTPLSVAIVCSYGVLLMLPVLASLLVVSVLRLGMQTLLIPLLTFAVVTLFLPFGFGNPYVARLARSLPRFPTKDQEPVLAQITLTPRIHCGFRAWIEDADDFGWLTLTDSGLEFNGDALKLFLPYSHLQQVRTESIGLRGLFLYRRLTLVLHGVPNVNSLAFAERSSCLLSSSRKRTKQLFNRLSAQAAAAKAAEPD
jgi:hypothetical protein